MRANHIEQAVKQMQYKLWDTLLPVMIHFLALQCLAAFGGNPDATARTSLAALVTLPIFWNWYQRERNLWKKEEKKPAWYEMAVILAGAVGLNRLFSSLIFTFVISNGVENTAQEALFAGKVWLQIVGTGLLVPFTEELLFRGLVFGKLERYLPSGTSVIVGAALFALYHGNVPQMLFAFSMGVILNLLYRHYGSLKMPFFFHAASNLGAIFFAL